MRLQTRRIAPRESRLAVERGRAAIAPLCEHSSLVRVVVSDPAFDLIEETGGRVYVWLKKGRCCGAVTTLATSNEPPRRREFVRVETTDQFELYLDARLGRLPEELHLDLRRFPRRVEAYWNGCAWVV